MGRLTDSPSPPETSGDPRRIGKWAHAYAQNRSLGGVLMIVVNLLLFAAIAGPSYYGGEAYRAGQWPLFLVCIAVIIAALAAMAYLAVPWWGGKLVERVIERLYAGEGIAQLAPPTRGRFWLMVILSAAGSLCLAAEIVLGLQGVIPEQYMQPVSAIYVVPILVAIVLLSHPVVGPIAILWPVLYALHAVLIVAGVPILFIGRWTSLNYLIPTAGYALLAGLIGHVYSRLALWKLRQAARGGLQDQTAEDPRP